MTTYYVATTGSNSNSGTTGSPFLNIAKGRSVMASGDTLYIRAGTYIESMRNDDASSFVSGTSWTTPTTIAGYPGETVILRPSSGSGVIVFSVGIPKSYIVFDNLVLDGGVFSGDGCLYLGVDSHHIRFSNGEMKDVQGDLVSGGGAYVQVLNTRLHGAGRGNTISPNGTGTGYGFYYGGHDSLFDRNEVYNNGGYGYHIYNSGQTNVSNNVISNNRIYGNGFDPGIPQFHSGILLSSGSNNVAYNNLVYSNARGIALTQTSNKAYHNTIVNNFYEGIGLNASSGNCVVTNNIIYNNGNGNIYDSGSSGTIFSHNLTTNPMFVST